MFDDYIQLHNISALDYIQAKFLKFKRAFFTKKRPVHHAFLLLQKRNKTIAFPDNSIYEINKSYQKFTKNVNSTLAFSRKCAPANRLDSIGLSLDTTTEISPTNIAPGPTPGPAPGPRTISHTAITDTRLLDVYTRSIDLFNK